MNIGDKVIYKNKKYTILGFAASVDMRGMPLVEIAWNDPSASVTGYLAVPSYDLYVKPCNLFHRLFYWRLRSVRQWSGSQGNGLEVRYYCRKCKKHWTGNTPPMIRPDRKDVEFWRTNG